MRTFRLPVGEGHELHVQEHGAADGVPALYLHGGPGGRLGEGYVRQVPLERTRLIGVSQRGAGESTPAGSLEASTTAHLVADIEVLREHLGIERWIIQGVSWGSTLALAYAQAHPERVRAMVLFAVTSTSRREVDWITEGVGALFPEAHQRLRAFAAQHGRGSERIVEAYRQMLADPALAERAAAHWRAWEDEHIRIGTGGEEVAVVPEQVTAQDLTFARLVTHYWAHDGFVADWAVPWGAEPGSGLLGGMERIAHIPAVLIHGRRDVSGPALTPWQLHRAWPASELRIVEDEGHGGPQMAALWREAMDRFTADGA